MTRIKLGLILNPWAGIGGPSALKGSDGAQIVDEALARGAQPRASERAKAFLLELADMAEDIEFVTCPGEMGQDLCRQLGLSHQLVPLPVASARTTAAETQAAAHWLSGKVDLLVFVGGDGTARDLVASVPPEQLCLGVPAGVKMHSGVFGVTPKATAEIVKRLIRGGLVSEQAGEVRDIDEAALRAGQVKTRFFGELRVPQEGRYLQHVKCGGREDPELVLLEIASWIRENLEGDCLYLLGSGKTTYAVKRELGIAGTLLGVDAYLNGECVLTDATESQLLELTRDRRCRLILSFIAGQGYLFGRGNQQLSAKLIRQIGKESIQIIATREKLATLAGRPLLVDTGDSLLNQELAGFVSILTGYDDRVLYRIDDLG